MSCSNFVQQPLIKRKKGPIGFEEKSSEIYLVSEEHIHLSLNIEESLHYFGTAADNDSISVQVPLFHPYHPDMQCLDRTMGFPSTPIAFECPAEYAVNLPVQIKQLLEEHKASKIYIRPFVQNMPWPVGVPLLFRPHHAIFAPTTLGLKTSFMTGKFSGSKSCRVGIFDSFIPSASSVTSTTTNITASSTTTDTTVSSTSSTTAVTSTAAVTSTTTTTPVTNITPTGGVAITVDRTPPNTLTGPLGFISHGGLGYTLCSPDGYGVVHGIDYTKSCSFYSVVITTDNEFFISPTGLLNLEDFQRLLKITASDEVRTIAELIPILHREKFAIAAMWAHLLGITLPSIET